MSTPSPVAATTSTPEVSSKRATAPPSTVARVGGVWLRLRLRATQPLWNQRRTPGRGGGEVYHQQCSAHDERAWHLTSLFHVHSFSNELAPPHVLFENMRKENTQTGHTRQSSSLTFRTRPCTEQGERKREPPVRSGPPSA